MEQRPTMFKVLSPVEGKNGKTWWMRVGSAFTNRDGSTNVYLSAYPTSGKLQIRAFDERERNSPGSSMEVHTGPGSDASGNAAQDDLPF